MIICCTCKDIEGKLSLERPVLTRVLNNVYIQWPVENYCLARSSYWLTLLVFN